MRDLSDVPAPAEPISMGPFELCAPIARGGMAQVWRGRHCETDITVAVKVLADEEAGDQQRRQLRHEVRSVAKLDHPNIVDVYDLGEISEATAFESGGRFRPGQPYVIMEHADGGTLRDLEGSLDWPMLRELSLTLLEALGHAHARDIVHRDLKPSNVLLVDDERGRRLAVSDFGLAHVAGAANPRVGSGACTQGTPGYMAPEQFREIPYSYGPWTDLYGLGCLTWKLACGRPPFESPNPMGVAWKHLEQPLPAFDPDLELPAAFDAWLERMLEKNPADRFDSAAAAARALRAVDRDGSSTSETDRRPEVGAFGRPGLYSKLTADPDNDDQCAVPTDFELEHPWRPRPYLAGTSLGLYSLRRPPLIDREHDRAILWDRLREVAETGSPHCILLRGPSGTGKTRLATWLRERAEELGCGVGMKAVHSPSHARRDGLAAMISRHLTLDEAGPDEHLDAIKSWFRRHGVHDTYAWRSTASILEEAGLSSDAPTDDLHLERFEQKAQVFTRFLRCAASATPVIVHLDDLPLSDRSLRFVEFVLDSAEDAPILFVGTVPDDTLGDFGLPSERLDALTRTEHTTSLEIGPLSPTDHRRLISELLDLEPSLQRQIHDRTGGNPLFTIQLLNDWVDHDLLTRDQQGFRLESDRTLPIPDNLGDFWSDRVGAFLDDFDDRTAVALELASALGQEVDLRIWKSCCAEAGIDSPDAILEALYERALAHPTDTGWAFAHPMLREGLEQRARQQNHWSARNQTCAAVLERSFDGTNPRLSARLARHAVEADQPRMALDYLLASIAHATRTGAVDSFSRLLNRLEEVIDRVGLAEDQPEYGEYLIRKARYLFVDEDRVDVPRRYLERAVEIARRTTCLELRAEAYRGLGQLRHNETAYESAINCYQKAIDLASRADACSELSGTLHRDLGETLIKVGRTESARDELNTALDLLDNLPSAKAKVHNSIAVSLKYDGRIDRARREASRALKLWRDRLSLHGEARMLNLLGDLERSAGDLERAAEYYDRACEITDILGGVSLGFVFLSRAQVTLELGDFETARGRLRRAGHEKQIQNVDFFQFAHRLFRAWCAAGLERWDQAHAALDQLETLGTEIALNAPDLRNAFEAAYDLAREAGRFDLANRLREHVDRRRTAREASAEEIGDRVGTA